MNFYKTLSFLFKMIDMNLIEQLKNAVIEGEEEVALHLANEIIKHEGDVQDAVLHGLCDGMKEVGKLYEKHEYFIPEIILSADALNSAFEVFKPYLDESNSSNKATVIIGVVKGDIHDIGKNILAQFLRISGYNIIDLGRNIHSDKFIEAAVKNKAAVICLSTLMTPTIEEMKTIVEKLKQQGIKNDIKVMIGGAPTDSEVMKEIGADYCCKDAIEAIEVLDELFIKKEGKG